jgi:hypothetical protein
MVFDLSSVVFCRRLLLHHQQLVSETDETIPLDSILELDHDIKSVLPDIS